MEDPSSAYEDMLFFERRLTEVIVGMQPKVRGWRIILFLLLLSTAYTAYYWISDPALESISLRESLAKHPSFTACVSILLILFLFFGVHKRVVAPKIIAQRCRYVLSDFCLSCDEHGKLIVRPAAYASSPPPPSSASSPFTVAPLAAHPSSASSSMPSHHSATSFVPSSSVSSQQHHHHSQQASTASLSTTNTCSSKMSSASSTASRHHSHSYGVSGTPPLPPAAVPSASRTPYSSSSAGGGGSGASSKFDHLLIEEDLLQQLGSPPDAHGLLH